MRAEACLIHAGYRPYMYPGTGANANVRYLRERARMPVLDLGCVIVQHAALELAISRTYAPVHDRQCTLDH